MDVSFLTGELFDVKLTIGRIGEGTQTSMTYVINDLNRTRVFRAGRDSSGHVEA